MDFAALRAMTPERPANEPVCPEPSTQPSRDPGRSSPDTGEMWGPRARRTPLIARLRNGTTFALVGMLLFSGYGTLTPASIRCTLPGAVGCPGGAFGPAGPSATSGNEMFFNVTMYDYGFWIIDTTSGANETKSWTVYEGWTIHVNATSLKADSSVGGTAYHGIGVELNATGKQLMDLSAGVNRWAAGTFTAPSSAYYHQHVWCTIGCGQGHDGMQVHILNVVPSSVTPHVTVKGSPTAGTAPLTVTFSGSVTGGKAPLTTSWNFGDGASANATANTSHTFAYAGSYTAVLTAVDSAGTKGSGSVAITVSAASPLNSSARISPSSGVAPFEVQLTGSGTGGVAPYSYAWNLGDGSSTTGAGAAHIYTSAGLYSVTLTVTDSTGATASSVGTVSARTPAGSLAVSATVSPTNGTAPVNASFSASASGATAPLTTLWLFGDGTSSTSSAPSHVYSTTGRYVATVYLTDATGREGSANVPLAVHGSAGAPLQVWMTADPTAGSPPLAVNASVSIEGGSDSYPSPYWQFGDGGVANGSIVHHSFPNLGTYNLTVLVTDSTGASATASSQVRVEGLQVQIDVNQTRGDAPFSVRAGVTVVGGSGSYQPAVWSWGDGTTSSGSPANHSYAATLQGAITLGVSVTDSSGAVATGTYPLQILPAPTANLTVQVENVPYPPTNATFTLAVSGGSGNFSDHPLWSFGDGSTTRGPAPQTHTYLKPGRFAVQVTTNDSAGRVAVATLTVTISGGAAAARATGGGPEGWVFTGVGDPNSAALSLLGFVAVSGLVIMFLKRPARPAAPARAISRPSRPASAKGGAAAVRARTEPDGGA